MSWSCKEAAAWVLGTGQEFLTISGGEPFTQPEAVAEVIDLVRLERDVIVTCYSGFYRADLEADRPAGSTDLLGRLDVLIDGPYDVDLHAPLLWRGSTNQTIHDLTGRAPIPAVDAPAGLTVQIDADGALVVIGVPPVPGVERQL